MTTKIIFIRARIEEPNGYSLTNIRRDIQDALDYVRVINGYKIFEPLSKEQADYVSHTIEDNPI